MFKFKASFGGNKLPRARITNFYEFLEAIQFKFVPYSKQVDMVEFCFKYDDRTKLVVARRKIGKSELIAIAGILWELYKDPKKTFIIISFNQSKSRAIIKTIASYMANSGLYNIATNNATTIKLVENRFSKEPSVEAMSLNTVLRGVHPDAIIFDDPLTMENADSQVMRQLAKTKYEESVSITKNIIIVGQPSHEEDLYQFLRNGEFPNVDVLELWNNDIPELKEDLQELKNKAISDRVIQANYEGILILDEDYPFANIKPVEFNGYRPQILFIDPAFSGKDDIGLAFLDEYDNKLYCYCKAIRGSILDINTVDAIFDIINTFDTEELQIFIEGNDNGGAYSYISRYVEDNNLRFDVYKVSRHTNKEKRIRDDIVSVLNSIRFIEPSELNYLHRFNPNLKNQRDDVPDAISSAIYVRNNYIKVLKYNLSIK